MISPRLEKILTKLFDVVTTHPLVEDDWKEICEELDIAALWYDICMENENRLRDSYTGKIIVHGRAVDDKIYIYDSGEEKGDVHTGEYRSNGTGVVHTYVAFKKSAGQQEHDAELFKFMSDIAYIIVSRQNMLSMLRHAESSDAQTGIPNAAAMGREYRRLLGAGMKPYDVSIVYLNLQNFKYINEEAGSKAGDEIIIRYARLLGQMVGEGEYVCRLGGDNFVLLIKNENLDGLLEKLGCINMRGIETAPGRNFALHPWIGISRLDKGEDKRMEDRLGEAAMACNLGKHKLKQSVVWFSESIREQMSKGKDIIMMYDSALRNHEFIPFFQAKVDMRTGELIGFESLCRWKHGNGYIYPDQFIPVLDKEGLVHQVDMEIFRQTCLSIRKWKDMGLTPPRVSSNFSRKNLFVEGIEDMILNTISESGIDVTDVEIEITESVKTNEYERLIEFMRILHGNGVLIAVDDFGTGYSSLSLIHSIDADVIKIDKSFVDNIVTDEKSRVLINSVIGIANNLNMEVIAEGVETAMQGRYLLDAGCNRAQGFYYSRPADFEATTEIISNPQFKPIA